MRLQEKIIGVCIRVYRRSPFYPRLGSLLAKMLSLKQKMVPRKPFIHNLGEYKIWIDLNEVIDANVYYAGSFEPDTERVFAQKVRAGDTVLDIGANIGLHTLSLAHKTGEKGKVIAFEPSRWACERLMKNINLNGYRNIRLENLGLSNVPASGVSLTTRSSYRLDGKIKVHSEIADFTTIDSYCAEQQILCVDFIKIDVDGFEAKILKGAEQILRQSRTRIIFELGPKYLLEAGDSSEELIAYLKGLGYTFFEESSLSPFENLSEAAKKIPSGSTINVYAEQQSA